MITQIPKTLNVVTVPDFLKARIKKIKKHISNIKMILKNEKSKQKTNYILCVKIDLK